MSKRWMSVVVVVAAMVAACGGKKGDAAPSGATETAPAEPVAAPAEHVAAPAEPVAAPAEPVAAPAAAIKLAGALDIGGPVMAADADDTSWKGISMTTAPAGAKVDASAGGTMLVIDDKMSVGLSSEKDLVEKKKEAQEGSLQKFARFVVDEPDAILWEAKSEIDGSSNYLLVVNVKLGEEKVKSCSTDGYGTFTEANARKVLEACRSLKLAAE